MLGVGSAEPLSCRHVVRVTDAAPAMSVTSRNTGDDLDLEVEAGEPVDADGGPVRVGWLAENLLLDRHDRSELVFGVGVEAGDVDDIIQRAPAALSVAFRFSKASRTWLSKSGSGVPSGRLPTCPDTNNRSPDRIAAE